MRRRVWLSGAAGIAVVAAAAAVAIPRLMVHADPEDEDAADSLGGCFTEGPYEACFTDPAAAGGKDTVIADRISELVAEVGKGDSLRIAMFTWSDGHHKDLAHDVAAAQERGADVQVVLDNTDGRHDDRETLEILESAGIPVTLCADTCLADVKLMHNKLFLFDVDGEKSVMLGSYNFNQSSLVRHNDMLRITGDDKLHEFFTGYWNRLNVQSWTYDGETWDSDADRSSTGDLAVDAAVYPREEDSLVQVLGDVEGCAADGESKVWISSWRVRHHRPEIRDELVRLHDAGCDVRVLIPPVDDSVRGHTDWPEMKEWLVDGGLDADKIGRHDAIHDKYTVIDAKYDGEYQGLVFMGSQNYNVQSLRKNDEATVLVKDDALAQLYVEFHEGVFAEADV
ncbi:MAG: phospholipase D-like domain-containing protein [Stackebrandtia sp.]